MGRAFFQACRDSHAAKYNDDLMGNTRRVAAVHYIEQTKNFLGHAGGFTEEFNVMGIRDTQGNSTNGRARKGAVSVPPGHA